MNNPADAGDLAALLQVQDIGEQGLLQRLQAFCPADVVGDDAAILTVPPGFSLVVTTDVLVDGVHFSDQTTSPRDVGWRAVAANLSDLAAMGAAPLGITVGLSLPGNVPVAWVEQLYEGMVACLEPYRSAIVGGDICRATMITLAIAAFGQVEPGKILRRSTAQVGDAVVVTGYHGLSRAGLEVLLDSNRGDSLTGRDRARLIQAHQRPQPRLEIASQLWQLADQHQLEPPYQFAGMDSSDGLADAIVQICRSSGVGAQIEREAILLHPALLALAPQQAMQWALYGGEDFELVLCLPATLAQILVERLGNGAAVIGTIVPGQDVVLIDRTGQQPDQPLTLTGGFQHF